MEPYGYVGCMGTCPGIGLDSTLKGQWYLPASVCVTLPQQPLTGIQSVHGTE